eukprot:6178849-Pleurochrysis_carterae.AAC.2
MLGCSRHPFESLRSDGTAVSRTSLSQDRDCAHACTHKCAPAHGQTPTQTHEGHRVACTIRGSIGAAHIEVQRVECSPSKRRRWVDKRRRGRRLRRARAYGIAQYASRSRNCVNLIGLTNCAAWV